jgi:CRP-like cAMP-binding protein
VRRGERIYLAGDPSDQVFLLKSGAVRITAAGPDGQEKLLAFLVTDAAPRPPVAVSRLAA